MRAFPILIIGICCGALGAYAQEATPDQFEEVPPPPPLNSTTEEFEPDITIIQRERETVREYRVNSRLYMVRIEPSIGPAYYLVDQDGDGRLESRFGDIYNVRTVPQWVLFSWD